MGRFVNGVQEKHKSGRHFHWGLMFANAVVRGPSSAGILYSAARACPKHRCSCLVSPFQKLPSPIAAFRFLFSSVTLRTIIARSSLVVPVLISAH